MQYICKNITCLSKCKYRFQTWVMSLWVYGCDKKQVEAFHRPSHFHLRSPGRESCEKNHKVSMMFAFSLLLLLSLSVLMLIQAGSCSSLSHHWTVILWTLTWPWVLHKNEATCTLNAWGILFFSSLLSCIIVFPLCLNWLKFICVHLIYFWGSLVLTIQSFYSIYYSDAHSLLSRMSWVIHAVSLAR